MENRDMNFADLIKKLSADDNTSNTDRDDKADNINNSTYRTIISCIISLPPKQYILLSSIIGILLIDNLDAKEQLILGKFINNIGQTIITSAAQEELNIKRKRD